MAREERKAAARDEPNAAGVANDEENGGSCGSWMERNRVKTA